MSRGRNIYLVKEMVWLPGVPRGHWQRQYTGREEGGVVERGEGEEAGRRRERESKRRRGRSGTRGEGQGEAGSGRLARRGGRKATHSCDVSLLSEHLASPGVRPWPQTEVPARHGIIVQRYIDRPLLLGDYKVSPFGNGGLHGIVTATRRVAHKETALFPPVRPKDLRAGDLCTSPLRLHLQRRANEDGDPKIR